MRGDKTKTSSPLEVKLREKYHAREARKKAQAYRPAILPPPEPEQRGDHAAAAEVSAPLSAAAKEELVTDIVAALDVDDERQSYCLDTVRFRLRSAKRLRRFYAKLLKPGERKEKLEALSRAWKKARKQLEDMKSDPLFRAQFEDGATPALDAPFTVNFHRRSTTTATLIACARNAIRPQQVADRPKLHSVGTV